MQEHTRTVYSFKNTCWNCLSKVEVPMLSDFAYGELLFQTADGQDYYLADLINNPVFDLVASILENTQTNPQKVLVLLADQPNGKVYALDYPICPLCRRRQRYFKANVRTATREIGLVTWESFKSQAHSEKRKLVEAAIETISNLRCSNR